MTDPKLLSRLVERYYTNQATPDELAVFIHLQKSGMLDEALEAFLSHQIQKETENSSERKQRFHWWHGKTKWAASVSILILSGYLLFHYSDIFRQDEYVKVCTNAYQEKNIKLSDGSQVTLNRNSEFAYPAEWGGLEREVRLIAGEAYFEIKKTTDQQSFIVHMPNGVDVNVIGTQFNIANTNGEARIYLESGSVKISRNGSESLLKPGQLAKCGADNQSVSISDANGDAWLAWKNDMFFFDDTPLAEVGKTLEDFYHKKVIIENKDVAALRFTGKVSRKDMDTVLRILASTLNIDIIHQNNRIIMEDPEDIFQQTD
ncbi:FecR family protein [Dyadobacter sp. CY312]|uniref:FecR family protein n=1 Tax=Dyadobacter sp. CY312 TaxID=2907303 RepID=UPI001F4383DD|nr:FecR domain-containing protein [Dyadobacter sp. CY312]MCE7041449.1 FecR domain-containing protein [Dyadobacter sp. CY312]